ncbi:hypothetical protein BOX15_Mlig014859g1 [Macrostomum lignano]|uniref:Aminopeptidase n=1 Tax=Macrostomum lignano TaxID=282301 RepID=A0A267H8A6_9PLAT|nr:hypothetical protein BOX15_Mlig014859g1 [Macrostomum lignano]
MSQFEEVQTVPLKDSSGNNLTGGNNGQARYNRRRGLAGLTMPRVLIGLVVLILLIIIVILAVLLTTGRCRGGSDESDVSGKSGSASTVYLDTSNAPCRHQGVRLPRAVLPSRYLLEMRPVLPLQNSSASVNYGKVDMTVVCQQATRDVIFHVGNEQNITKLTVVSQSRADVAQSVELKQHCIGLSQMYLRLARTCEQSETMLITIEYVRVIDNKLDGFYLGTYRDKKKVTRNLASTHMEPISARKAFPCFDEPDMKAKFELHMIRDSQYQTLFNMPLNHTRPDTACGPEAVGGCYRDVFDESVVMSTYLVAFAILPLDYGSLTREVPTKYGSVKVGIWAPSYAKDHLQFAMNVTEKVLPYFEDFFNLPYPLPKLDMIGVPDFSAGAMENWGLIIYRFLTLLYDPVYTQTLEKQNVAEVITHEIAHQWFGNIVTMTWWDDLWLNEAFATFTQFIGVDVYNPTWNMMDRCYVEFVMNALQTDSMLHSHPIIMAGVSDPSEIESLFDDISYFKGSSLIRMLEGVIGRRVLKEGLMIYLNRFAWRNAASKDLFEAFSEAYRKINQNSGAHSNSPAENLTRVMDTWTTQVNYPLVTVRISGNRLHFRQERFLLYPNGTQIWESHQTKYNYKWIIPVMYLTDKTPEPMWTWLDLEESKTVELDHTPAFVKINLNQTGLYRCNYEFSNWQQLVKLSRQGYFGSTDMAGLLNDAFTLAYIGRLNISVPFDLFETLEEDRLDSGTPWTISMRKISELQPLMAQDQQSAEKLVKLIFKVLRKPLKAILSKPQHLLTHTEKIKRQTLNQIAVMVDEPIVANMYREKYQQWRANQSIILSPDEIDFVYQLGITGGNTSDWEFFWNKYNNDFVSTYEKKHMISALAMSPNLDIINRLIQILFDQGQIRQTDAITIAVKFARRSGALDLVWTHFTRNWDQLLKIYGHMPFLMSDITKFPADYYTEFDYERTREFFETHSLTSGKRNAYQSLESIRANIAWIKHNMESFKTFIKNKVIE